MKKHLKIIGCLLVALFVVVGMAYGGVDGIISFVAGGGAILMTAPIVGPGSSAEGTLTTEDVKDAGLTEDDLNKIVVKVRPSDTPLDTLTRQIGNVAQAKNRETGGYEVGTRDVEDATTLLYDGTSDVTNLRVGKKSMWQASDTIYLPEIMGGDNRPLMLYVCSKDNAASTLQVVAANPVEGKIPAIASATKLIRLSKAMGEVDAQTDPFTTLPTDRRNYTQIHMTQVEVSVLSEIQKKVVPMDFTTHKEISIWDWKRAMELTNLFGKKGKFLDPVANKYIYTSDGLWNQLTGVSEYNASASPTNADWVRITKEIFDGNNGNDRRVLLAGSEWLQWASGVEAYSKQQRPEGVEIVHGVRFNKIITNFGELLVKPMSSLFVGDMAKCAMVLDLSYIRKDVQEALNVVELDLDKTGQRRVKAVRMIENYCLYAENLPVHRKIMPQVG